MSELYPSESQRLNILQHLEELRRRILRVLAVFVCLTAVSFAFGPQVFEWTTYPLRHLPGRLIFISPMEGFTAYMQVSLLAGFLATFPFLLYQAWRFLAPAFTPDFGGRILLWLLLSLVLFAGGVVFSYAVLLPAAFDFLIGFGSRLAAPQITLGSYIAFFVFLVLSGGLVFQIPVVLGFLGDTGLVSAAVLRSKRPHAWILMLVIAAVITPTQDIFNLLLFSIPMIFLYECGILLAGWSRTKGRGT
ncbi:MAG: twin-arginine translocase subunit TatC [Candidatus Omnitrophica bacterium]|nr:twin-arginine translocase subunit TatC [Candidatus Omnitrophota bacterium]